MQPATCFLRRRFDALHPPPATRPKSQWRPPPPPRTTEWSEDEIADDLLMTIMAAVDPDGWITNGGRVGNLRYWSGMLIIQNTPDNHERLEHFLDQLRQHLASAP